MGPRHHRRYSVWDPSVHRNWSRRERVIQAGRGQTLERSGKPRIAAWGFSHGRPRAYRIAGPGFASQLKGDYLVKPPTRPKAMGRKCSNEKGVLLIGSFLSASGLTTRSVSEDLALRLAHSGWSVLTASSRRSRPVRLADMLARVCFWRRRYGIAHIEVYSGAAFVWAEAVCCLLSALRKPHVLTLHGGSLPEFGRRWPRRVSWLFDSAAVVTTPSQYLRTQMASFRPDIRVVPNAIEIGRYSYRHRRHLSPSLVWLRAYHGVYNPSMALRTVTSLVGQFPEIRLTMAGPDKGDGTLQKTRDLVVQLDLDGRVCLIGNLPKTEVPDTLAKGDIFINTSNVDNTPVSVIEAMASGMCVVSTKVGGLPHLLDHEQDSLLVPPDDYVAMSNAVERLLREPDLAGRLSLNARKKAERFDWSVVLPLWEEIFTSSVRRAK